MMFQKDNFDCRKNEMNVVKAEAEVSGRRILQLNYS